MSESNSPSDEENQEKLLDSAMREKESLCCQATCSNVGAYRYTWPGRNEAVICLVCANKLRNVASAMGIYVQLIPLA